MASVYNANPTSAHIFPPMLNPEVQYHPVASANSFEVLITFYHLFFSIILPTGEFIIQHTL